MKLVELIIDILEKSEIPLTQGEILSIAEKHEKYYECEELQKVQVPLSAVARCLTKYSSGSNPVFGIQNEGKAKKSKKHFFLKSKNIPEATTIKIPHMNRRLINFFLSINKIKPPLYLKFNVIGIVDDLKG